MGPIRTGGIAGLPATSHRWDAAFGYVAALGVVALRHHPGLRDTAPAMSQENVEVVRAAFEAYNAGDMDGLRELYDPDAIIVRGLEGWPEPSPIVGRDAVMRLFEGLREAWDEDTLEPTSLIDAGDRVIARQMWHAVGRGPDMNMDMTVVITLRGGKVFLMEYFWNYAEALDAVGLSE